MIPASGKSVFVRVGPCRSVWHSMALLVVLFVALGAAFAASAAPSSDSDSDTDAKPSSRSKDLTVAGRLKQVGPRARARLKPRFAAQDVTYPPARLTIVGLKRERRLKLYAANRTGKWRYIAQYPIAAASGVPGPKLREGDMQVPEGIYRIDYLNPQSIFHLSLAISYPNEFDRRQGRKDGRKRLGGDIMIHGSWYSEGCLALGDTAAEDMFVLAADTGLKNIRVLLAPLDFRHKTLEGDAITSKTHPAWTVQLYMDLKRELSALEDGVATESLLVRYDDSAPPPDPKEPEPSLVEVLSALYDAVQEVLEAAADQATTSSQELKKPE